MAWRDDYRPGSFRGVPFHLKSSSSTGGRRTVLNEFPLRDTPMTEDMGRRARQFQLNLTLIGVGLNRCRNAPGMARRLTEDHFPRVAADP